ncbi:MAG: hypothetical protein R2813_03845 [Flavobacteriales bacterium]
MKTTILKYMAYMMLPLLFSLSACKRDDDDADDPHGENEEELITTVEVGFTNSASNTHSHYRWVDADGAGGSNPVIDTIFLDTNASYSVELEFLDESGEMVDDITEEIKSESKDHIICFDLATDKVTISRTDSDGQYGIGLQSTWSTTDAIKSSATISLKHQPDVKDGTCNPGETDVEVTFPLVIQ